METNATTSKRRNESGNAVERNNNAKSQKLNEGLRENEKIFAIGQFKEAYEEQRKFFKSIKNTISIGRPIMEIVKCPELYDCNEWIAFNTQSFVERVKTFWNLLQYFCIDGSRSYSCCESPVSPNEVQATCMMMSVGLDEIQLWQYKRDRVAKDLMTAPSYIERTIQYGHNLIDDENYFPRRQNQAFPEDFLKEVSFLYSKILDFISHIYYHHYDVLILTKTDDLFNTFYLHFWKFADTHGILKTKDNSHLEIVLENLQGNIPKGHFSLMFKK